MNSDVSTFTGHLYMLIENLMMTSIKHIKRSKSKLDIQNQTNKNLMACGDTIREACTQIGAACASLVHVAESVIKFTAIYYPNAVHDIVNYSAIMEHTAIISNKELFILELYFYQVLTTLIGDDEKEEVVICQTKIFEKGTY